MTQAKEEKTRKQKNKHDIFKLCPHICIYCSEIITFQKRKEVDRANKVWNEEIKKRGQEVENKRNE
jgi:predicted translin family RNA/ssDNA-binding protein